MKKYMRVDKKEIIMSSCEYLAKFWSMQKTWHNQLLNPTRSQLKQSSHTEHYYTGQEWSIRLPLATEEAEPFDNKVTYDTDGPTVSGLMEQSFSNKTSKGRLE